jgi:D-sedoheptulose 7-phosphate isomerase
MKHLVQRQLAQSIATLQAVLADEQISDTLATIGKLTADAMRSGHKLLAAGNGGSAADAQHLVAEFVVRLTVNRPALRAIALTTDTSILTAAGNDYGFDHVFERQIEALGQPGDVFLGISTSGNSPNILKALYQAKKIGIATIGFSGNDGGKMRELCDHNIIIPSNVTMNIQESHLALEHIFCMIVERCTFGPDFDTRPQILSE